MDIKSSVMQLPSHHKKKFHKRAGRMSPTRISPNCMHFSRMNSRKIEGNISDNNQILNSSINHCDANYSSRNKLHKLPFYKNANDCEEEKELSVSLFENSKFINLMSNNITIAENGSTKAKSKGRKASRKRVSRILLKNKQQTRLIFQKPIQEDQKDTFESNEASCTEDTPFSSKSNRTQNTINTATPKSLKRQNEDIIFDLNKTSYSDSISSIIENEFQTNENSMTTTSKKNKDISKLMAERLIRKFKHEIEKVQNTAFNLSKTSKFAFENPHLLKLNNTTGNKKFIKIHTASEDKCSINRLSNKLCRNNLGKSSFGLGSKTIDFFQESLILKSKSINSRFQGRCQ